MTSTLSSRPKTVHRFSLIAETDDYIVVNKPPFLLTHPTKPSQQTTRWKELRQLLAFEIANLHRLHAAPAVRAAVWPILELPVLARGPFTSALLRLDPIFDLLRSDPRFQKLAGSEAPK